ncbi:MAG: hypothetical protein LBL64_01320, partial [Treponema sp.]|nr:hypothetical protein [Treponema sp.]
GLWLVACGLWLVACGLWLVACGLWLVACGLWLVACGLWLGRDSVHVKIIPNFENSYKSTRWGRRLLSYTGKLPGFGRIFYHEVEKFEKV